MKKTSGFPHRKSKLLTKLLGMLFSAILLPLPSNSAADEFSAQLAMEDARNPLLLLRTSLGDIYVEMLPAEAPSNVQNFIALSKGEIEFTNTESGFSTTPRYFNGARFHRVTSEFVIQAGSPSNHALGYPFDKLKDEINADALGLNDQPVINPDGSINKLLGISNHDDFAQEILEPLYAIMDIRDEADLLEEQFEVLESLQSMDVKRAYENQGFSYTSAHSTRPVTRGTVALANQGPDSNGPEFFISLKESDGLTGRYTVIGLVVEGLEVADNIGTRDIDPLVYSSQSTVIYSIRQVNEQIVSN